MTANGGAAGISSAAGGFVVSLVGDPGATIIGIVEPFACVAVSDHRAVTGFWNGWRRGLGGVPPSAAEIMRQALVIDELFGDAMRFI